MARTQRERETERDALAVVLLVLTLRAAHLACTCVWAPAWLGSLPSCSLPTAPPPPLLLLLLRSSLCVCVRVCTGVASLLRGGGSAGGADKSSGCC
eukprot:COSAG05_NODE_1864_length_3937_cov_21.205315_4_plen_96_part_00